MRSRIVTPEEMDLVYGAEVSPFRFAFVLTRRQSVLAQSGGLDLSPSAFQSALQPKKPRALPPSNPANP